MRAWNKDGYHKDILVIDSDQVRMNDGRVKELGAVKMIQGGYSGPSMVINPADFPEMESFQIIVEEYRR